MIHYSHCPVCSSTSIEAVLTAKDHTVSNELFVAWKCNECTVMFTQDVPVQDAIGKYYQSDAYVSHSDTKEGFINKLYHRVRNITLAGKRKLVKKEAGIASGTILDVGCGTGAFLNTMKQAGWFITGLEPDDTARQHAQSLYNISPLPPQELFNLPAENFDVVTMWHVLEHVHQLHEYVEQFRKILTEKGKLFIAVPNYTSGDAATYGKDWAAYDVPRHLYHFSPKSMSVLMERHGMTVKKMKPMWFDSFYVSMLSEQYKSGKGNIVNAFFAGLSSNMKAFFHTERCSSIIYIIEKK